VHAGPVVDLGAGTGGYVARALGADRAGLALDSSKHALRRAARAHARIGAVGCDVWRDLPVRDGAAATALSIFAPRNGPEIARILSPGGRLVAVTPSQRHLAELVEAFGLLTVDSRKRERLDEQLGPHLEREAVDALEFDLTLDPGAATALIRMGPSAHHVAAEADEPVNTTVSVELSVWRRP
jgi:23S rRNA (guanine745-N1)-methyltransferase